MPDSTYCPQLWDGFTIDNKGSVFSCCHIQPLIIGNIYFSKLADLSNNENIVKCRKDSLQGQLHCYPNCNLIKKTAVPQNLELISPLCDYSTMRRLHLNFGEKCNIACIMCKQPKRYTQNQQMLDPEVLIRNIDVTPFEEIVIQGGETLYISQCLRYMDYLATQEKKYTVLTNGLFIDDSMAEKLSLDANVVSISINAATKATHEKVNRGSSWEKLLLNIQRLVRAREENGTELTVYGRMTLTTFALHEIPLFLKTYREIGFDKINFGYDKATVPDYLKNNPGSRDQLAASIRKSLEHSDVENIDLLRLEQLGLL